MPDTETLTIADEIARLVSECLFTESDLLAPVLHPSDAGSDWINRGTYPTYWAVGKLLEPASIAEIGVRYGYSMHSMMKGSGKVRYAIGFDNEYDFKGSNQYVAGKVKPLNVQLLDTQAVKELPMSRPVDLFHVDATHTADGTYHDCKLAWKYVKPGGMLLIDDVSAESVKTGADRFCGELGLTPEFIACYRGMYLVQKSK